MKSPVISQIARPLGLNPAVAEAYSVLDGQLLSRELADRLAKVQGPDIMELAALAHKVRCKFAPNTHACTILNAKSGACPEDCRFCSQSAHHQATVETFPLLSVEAILAAAEKTYQSGIRCFGIVTSGTGYPEHTPEFQSILDAVDAIYKRFPDMSVCASIGFLSETTASALAKHRVVCSNVNLQVNPERYAELISTTHTVSERIETIRQLKKHGIKACTGGILGLGESMADRVAMAYQLRDLDVDHIPLNVLIPIPGTPLDQQPPLPTSEIVKTFALFRLILPTKTIKFAAGRETRMKDFQGLLMLSGANGLLTGGYLTTRGRDVAEDQAFLDELEGFRV